MAAQEKFWIWIEGEHDGPHSTQQLYRMAMKEEIEPDTLYFSDAKQDWRPLREIANEWEQEDRLRQIKAVGIDRVRVLGSGHDDCPSCAALQSLQFAIDQPPVLPPGDCTCRPWCRCMIVSAQ